MSEDVTTEDNEREKAREAIRRIMEKTISSEDMEEARRAHIRALNKDRPKSDKIIGKCANDED